MALQKAIAQESGYEATYWRIDRLQIDWRNESASVRLTGYKDEEVRQEDVRTAVMDQRNYSIREEEFENFFDIPDLEDYSNWDSQTDYNKEEIVSYDSALYQANESVASGGSDPKVSNSWEIYKDLRANRKIAYDYIKNNDIDFTDATNV